jgi:hypothetical protein
MMAMLAVATFCSVTPATAAVIEFYNPDLDNYFITADPVEQDFVDTGAVGRWERTGNAFAAGGPNLVCRFYGNTNTNPATGTFYGPNSHFYTASPTECDGLKAQFAPNAKSWKFESNDFATTIAANGSCAANLVPVYRAYNNGFARGVDSNHRITSNRDDYQRTINRGWIGEGIVMCAPGEPPPVATAVGSPIGSATTATIGAGGGTLATPDGRIKLTIPAGALAGDTAISIQPVTNLAPGGFGSAFRLTPEGQTFAMPVTLAFAYTDDDLIGTAAEFLGAAFQTADGFWQWAGDPALDTAAKTVSVSTTHFSIWSGVSGLQIVPGRKTVRVNTSVALEVKVCYQVVSGGVLSLASSCDVNQSAVSSLSISEWSVNGRLGGGAIFGTVNGHGATATYRAPANEPIPNTVAVSARVHRPFSGSTQRRLVVSNITIAGHRWEGTATSRNPAYTTTANVVWTLENGANGISTYVPNGTVTVEWPNCSLSPAMMPISQSDGFLTIDFNADPPKYEGFGVTDWHATISCPSGQAPIAVNALFFAGHFPGDRAQGTVSVQPGGQMIIQDTDSIGPLIFNWNFVRKDDP